MLENLGNLGDFISGIAVVITLLYLTLQIRQNTAAVQAATFQAAAQANAELMDRFASDPELLSFYDTGTRDFESFSPEDRLRFATIMGSIMYRSEWITDQANRGLIPHEALEGAKNLLRSIFAHSGTRAWWLRGKNVYSRRHQEWIDSEIIGKPVNLPPNQ